MAEPKRQGSGSWILPDKLWDRMEELLPKYSNNPRGGRPRRNLRDVANGIFYVLRTGCQWKAVPREHGSGSTLHRYFQHWEAAGVFRRLWRNCLLEYDELKGIQWNWQSVDGAMTKSPLGGGKYRQKSDRSRQAGHQAIRAH
jgi:transposase